MARTIIRRRGVGFRGLNPGVLASCSPTPLGTHSWWSRLWSCSG
jgi:hypothetical protein